MEWVELGEILSIEKGKKPEKQSAEQKKGYLPYVNIEVFETGRVSTFTDGNKCVPCEEGDILIVCDGARSGLIGLAKKGYAGSTLAKLTANNLERKFLFYFLQSKFALLNTRTKGSGTPHLNIDLLKQQKIVLLNKEEQMCIVAQIEKQFSKIDAGVENLQKITRQIAAFRQAVLKEAFEKVSEGTKNTILSVCEKVIDCPHSTPKWTKEGKICLRTTNFQRGFLDLREKNFVSNETFDERNRRLVPRPGDILFSREGAILGIACIIPENVEVCLGQRMMLLRPKSNINNMFLMHYLNSPMVNKLVMQNVGGTASPHINVGAIKEILIPIPNMLTQLEIVKEIETRLSICDSIEKIVETALRQAESMRQSILKNAFEGRF